jgi:hypothetical protein
VLVEHAVTELAANDAHSTVEKRARNKGVSGPNLGEWSLSGLILPARQAAFEDWAVNDAYFAFLQSELERAQPFPNAASGTIISALSTAVFDVISSTKSPQIAAEDAAEAVNP